MPTYVAGDIRSIQDYIFASPRLYEMRGASTIIDFFDRKVVPRFIADLRGRRVSSGGGNFLAIFEGEEEHGAELEEKVKNAFFRLTGGHEIAVESLTTDEAFPQAQAQLHRRLRRRKQRPEGAQPSLSMPFLKRCESCGREPADVPWPFPDRPDDPRRQWLGAACDAKRQMARRLAEARETGKPARHPVHGLGEALPVPMPVPRLANARPPRDFEELVQQDDLATLVADGNGIGEWFAELDGDRYTDLSERVDAELRSALEAAIDSAFPHGGEPRVQVLICGGDDLVVALPARHALPFAQALLAGFRLTHEARPGQEARLAAGLLVSKHSFPFRQAHALAHELLYRAKRRCHESQGPPCALDFLRVTATHVQSLEKELQALTRDDGGDHGWSYGAAGPYSPDELSSVVELAAQLKAKVSPSQRGRLREILSPRDDGPHSPLDPERQVPKRVVAELEAWRLRQEQEPFSGPLPETWDLFVRADCRSLPGGALRTYQRWRLADALILTELMGA